jgi:hypothetical protein
MAGGGNNQMLDMGLMIAAGIAAPELAPVLMEGGAAGLGLGATEATALTGAGLGGLAGAATGQNVGQSALMGGLGGAAAGYFGGVQGAEPGSMLAQGPTVPGAGFNTVPQTSGIAGIPNVSAPTPTDYANFTGQSALNAPPPVNPASITPQTASTAASNFDKANIIGGGVAGIGALLNTPPAGAYVPPGATYTGGSLSKFKYDPLTYQPDIVLPPTPRYRAQYAEGGIAALAMGGQPGQMYPMSQQEHTNFMNPTQLPASAMAVRNYEPATNPMTGELAKPMAEGGITQLAVGGKLLKGSGDGMSDDIRANIDGKQEARLADGEFVIPADVVSHLGNGSTDAGAKHLYSMMDRVRKARTGNPKQGRQINPNKYLTA